MADEVLEYVFEGGYLNRAVQAYRQFFPSVSGLAIFKGSNVLGVVENKVFGTLETQPKHKGLTLNSDTPYAPLLLDLRGGPMVIASTPPRTAGRTTSATGKPCTRWWTANRLSIATGWPTGSWPPPGPDRMARTQVGVGGVDLGNRATSNQPTTGTELPAPN